MLGRRKDFLLDDLKNRLPYETMAFRFSNQGSMQSEIMRKMFFNIKNFKITERRGPKYMRKLVPINKSYLERNLIGFYKTLKKSIYTAIRVQLLLITFFRFILSPICISYKKKKNNLKIVNK